MAAVRYLVDDLDAAVGFYVDRLGFAIREDWGPVVVVTRGDIELWLSGGENGDWIGENLEHAPDQSNGRVGKFGVIRKLKFLDDGCYNGF